MKTLLLVSLLLGYCFFNEAAFAFDTGGPKKQTGKNPENRPNIIFILTDDQRFDALGAWETG